ncbi:MAG: single-stranded DNA-binding protein [Christensenella sp.]
MDLNIVTMTGRLASEPELKMLTDDKRLCRSSLAVQRPKRANKDAETDFFDLVAWQADADFLSKYFHKGDHIAINGAMRTSTYEKDGVKRTRYEINVDKIAFVGARKAQTE